MGVVYRATHMTLDITVAVKVIRPELARDAGFRERFKRESRLAASIEHPNVLPVRHAGEEDGLLYITMRYVEGTDLRALLDRDGRLDPAIAVDLTKQVAAALDAAHARGLVHRDVKPANVLIEGHDANEHAFLTDFGLTRRASSQSGLTRTGQWVGTLDYVAPEQIEGKKVDARADVYALGCMLYEMLSGEVPFLRDSEVATIYAHLQDDPPTLADKGSTPVAALDAVVRKAMSKAPDDRFQSAGEMARTANAALSGALAEAGTSSAPAETKISQRPAPADVAAAASSDAGPAAPETKISQRAAGKTRTGTAGIPPSATPPAQPPSPAPPASAPTPQRGRSRGLLIGLGVAAILAIGAIVVATGLSGGGSDPTTTTSSTTTPEVDVGAARSVIDQFAAAFKHEGQAGIETLLAPNAKYKYPGFATDTPQEEYRNLFSSREIHGYQLEVTSIEPAGDSVRVTGTYNYNTGPGNPFSGTVTFVLEPDPASGALKIAEIDPIPDLYVFFDNTAPPASVTATIRIGSTEVARQHFELAARAKSIPLRLPIEPGAEAAFDSRTDPQGTTDYHDGDGHGVDHFKINGYPYAS